MYNYIWVKSVETVATLVQDSFNVMPYEQLDSEVERARNLCGRVASNTNGVLTYYFRIGGDEFAVILENDDYLNRETLLQQFRKARAEICEKAENDWNQVNVTMGLAL